MGGAAPSVEESLRIGFDITRTHALLRAAKPFQADLARLLARFPDGRMAERLAAAVPVDSFLSALDALADWPDPAGVVWEAQFQALVLEALDDAERAERQLGGGSRGEVSTDDVPSILGRDWCAPLTGFQRRDTARLLSLGHGANFSVPGAGKTRVALAVFAALRERSEVRRLLVVCPKSAYEAWRVESRTCFRKPLEVGVADGHLPLGADALLVNYERLHRSMGLLVPWLDAVPTMLVLDEAHRMKLGSAGVYGAACMALGPLSRVRLILTGTPAPNGVKDLENLLSFVWPGRGRRVVREAVDGGDLSHASRVLRPLYTRTTKKELGLPPVETRIRRVPMPPLHREIYDALAGRFTERAEASRSDFDALGTAVLRMLMAAVSPALLREGASRSEPVAFQSPSLEVPVGDSLYQLFQQLPDYELPPKYLETAKIVTENAALGRKTLVWTGFVRSITTLASLLESFQPAVVYGGTLDREEQIRRFREDPECTVLLSNPATLGEGISLHQVCHDAVYVDRNFQAGQFLQSLDRIHRLGLAPGTETRVTVLAAEETVDEIVALRLEEKLEFMGRVLDDPAVQQLADLEEEPAAVGGVDAADVQALLAQIRGGRSAVWQ